MPKTLLVIDIQKEYTTDGRPFQIKSIATSLENARKMLEKARSSGWNILHIRHLQAGPIFSPESPYSAYVEGFEPKVGEKEFTKGNFSCFSSPEFEHEMRNHQDSEIVVIGYGSGMCCLSTIVDGYHRGFKMTFVKDASNAKAKSFDEAATHSHMTDAISTFASVITTAEA